jgi:Domain of unknown function (DUF4253)
VAKDTSRLVALLVAAALTGCADDGSSGKQDPRAGGAEGDVGVVDTIDPSYLPKREAIVVERYPEPPIDFRREARSRAFRQAVASFEQDSEGARVRVDGIPGAAGFRVDHRRADSRLTEWNASYRDRGAFVFRYDNTFGYGGRDAIILLPTKDKFTVLRAVATNGANYDISTGEVVAWLRELDRTHPFVLTEAGIDVAAGHFVRPVRDALSLARRMYRFCPDIVDQGTGDVATLADELERTQDLYLWWD